MIGAAMSSVLHRDDKRLDDLIDDWKALFPAVPAQAATATKRTTKVKR